MERQRHDPLPVGDVGEHVINEMSGDLCRALCHAARAETSTAARKRHRVGEGARGAAAQQEAVREDATGEIGAKLLLHMARELMPLLRHACEKERKVLVHHLVKRARFGATYDVGPQGKSLR